MTLLYILMWIGDVALFFSCCLNTCSGFSGSGELFKNMNTHGDFTPHRVVLPLRAIPPAQVMRYHRPCAYSFISPGEGILQIRLYEHQRNIRYLGKKLRQIPYANLFTSLKKVSEHKGNAHERRFCADRRKSG